MLPEKIIKPGKKVKLANKLTISPLTQEFRGLGHLSTRANPNIKEPIFTKYSHREIVLPAKQVSPKTHMDEDQPSLLTKQKAKKLVLLQ